MKLLSFLDPDVRVLLPDNTERKLLTYQLPSALLMLSAMFIVVSIFLPYWSLMMTAPQYPKGLTVSVFVNRIAGDVSEVDALNHYLGMPPLDNGGQLERSVSVLAMVVVGLTLVASVFVHNRWAAALVLPVIVFPLVFLADLYLILYQYGHSIDPKSALGGAIAPFTPPIFGEGKIGQFGTYSYAEPGLYLAFAAVAVALIGLYFHRRAYKPIHDARKKVEAAKSAAIPAAAA